MLVRFLLKEGCFSHRDADGYSKFFLKIINFISELPQAKLAKIGYYH